MTNTTAPTTTPSLPPLPTCILKQFVTETPSTTTTGIEGKHNDASALATARISRIEFSLLTSKDVSALSHVPIVNRSLYEMNKREPTKWGCLDKRLGTSDKKGHCDTCHRTIADCIGHFGHISLELPVFHIGYFKEVQKILQMICKHCSAILLKPMERTHYLKLLRRDAAEGRQNASRRREAILDQCKKLKQCDKCGSFNGQVKKITGIFRLIHDLKHKDAQEERENFLEEFRTATKYNKQLKEHLSKATVDLNPLICLYLFQRISDEDAELMGFNRHKGRPEDMIITQLTVPPVCIRPSVTMGSSGSNEDDLTIKLADIVHINNYIKSAFAKGALPAVIIENWEFLQQQVAMYVNSDLPGFPKTIANVKPIRALTQRLKGKTGRFRGNLSGKRVDFSGRTVISPDPNLRIDEVGVPERVAKNMTYPERVNAHNIEVLRQAVRNGCDIHPGANHVESTNGMKTFLKYGNRNKIAAELRYGDIVERHLRNGDFVLFNRQPSLHKMSIMCHRVRVLQWRTFRFNECVCTPYNADFDGDEMNLHVPQTEEARTEALTLMGVHENLVTPRHGEPLVTPTQDFLTTSFLITQKDVFYDQSQFCQICCYFNDGMENIELPMPAIVKPIRLWTGKQIFSVLLRPNSIEQKWPRVNIEFKARNYSRNEMLCPQDGYVVFRNSELMCGNICKGALGGDKTGLTYSLIRDSSQYVAAEIMNRIAKLSARWIGNRGFSIGIDDVTPSESLLQMKNGLVQKGYEKCDTYIDQFVTGKLEAQPGCDEIQTLESLCLGELSAIREDAGSYCLKTLDSINNSPLIMAICGSKGSKINISQMIACVGQQAVSGHRIPSGFVNRTLPHFPKFSRTPEAKGFVENSFYSGLTATEFFFHTMGGREGLVDTAVKTAETGYMQRRLMKALEDLCVQYDGSVRTSEKQIVQFLYGDDGLDPVMMAQDKKPVVFTRVMQHVRATVPAKDEPAMLPQDIIKNVDAIIATWPANQFRLNLKEYIDELAKQLTTTMQTLNLLPGGEKSSLAPIDALHILNLTQRITPSQLSRFLELCREKFSKAMMEPGTSVGAVGAQSIGEPGTQMTLKTFHFAGVASMNITLGVPRIKEIINAAKKISSPIITAPLEMDKDVKAARIVKARIEKTTLGEIAEYIEEVFSPGECYLLIKLDMHAIEMLQLSIDAESVVRSILSTKKMKLKQGVKAKGKDIVKVYPPDARKETMLYSMSTIKTALPSVIVRGIKDVSRAVINAGKEGTYHLLVEGNNLLGVMGTLGVKGIHTTSNHIIEVEKVLGIEAARVTIAKEINTTMESHGLSIDCRHVNLLADVMSYKGTIHGITRFGVAKMKESVLMLASFEKTADHLFEAALRGSSDHINGVSECIIMGTPIPVGTGLFQLLHQVPQKHDRTYPKFERSSLLLHKAESPAPASTGRSR